MPPTPTGAISFLDIIQEFGNLTDNDKGNSTNNPDPVKLGDYRTSVNYKSVTYPLDTGVPTSGAISFDDLRGKRLNIIVKVHTNNTSYKANARDLYNDRNRNISIVGNGRDKKFKNSRIHIVVTGIWGSEEGTFPRGTSNSQTNRRTCAIRTGSWTSSGVTPTSVDLRVGGSQSQPGYIIGGGGRGGAGGASDGETDSSESYKANGHNGCIATSGLGLDTPLRNLEVRSPGRIQAGCGGGGGGGGAGGELSGDRSNERAGGGGGGGGSGIPDGQGGAFGYRNDSGHLNQEIIAQAGTRGSSNTGGNGGRGADNSEETSPFEDSAQGGGGGGGGGINKGEGGQGTEGAQTGAEGEEIDGTNDADRSGEGGAGGNGDAEGQGQQVGTGGLGGQHGLAIDVNGNEIGEITGSNRIYGRYNLV
jgi:hypothetical protein